MVGRQSRSLFFYTVCSCRFERGHVAMSVPDTIFRSVKISEDVREKGIYMP